VDGNFHVLALVEHFAPYATAMRGGIALATDVEDTGRAALYTDLSGGIDKRLWGLEAHLYRWGASAEPGTAKTRLAFLTTEGASRTTSTSLRQSRLA
jgi:hypothetical protein